jgi:hypothetical protein
MSRNECLLEERMGLGLDPDEILADFTRAGIGQMLQKKQMASPFLRNGEWMKRRQGEREMEIRYAEDMIF